MRGKMPRLRGLPDDAGQDALPTRVASRCGARCPTYGGCQSMRGKMPRLRGVPVDAGQDAPPTGVARRCGARCTAYEGCQTMRGKMPRLRGPFGLRPNSISRYVEEHSQYRPETADDELPQYQPEKEGDRFAMGV